MAHPWHDVHPGDNIIEGFLGIIEIPKGSKNKYELDKKTASCWPTACSTARYIIRQLRLHPQDLLRRW